MGGVSTVLIFNFVILFLKKVQLGAGFPELLQVSGFAITVFKVLLYS
jgi:hypothetical protein